MTADIPAQAVTGRRANLLAVVVLPSAFIVPLSISGTAVALRDISVSLGASVTGEQWALNGFNLSFACSTLIWGSVADTVGRWRALSVGLLVFVVGSSAASASAGYLMLNAGRLVAGAGAGVVFAVGSALLSAAFPKEQRGRVF